MKDNLHAVRLEAFLAAQAELERSGKIESLNDWCTKAGLRWSTVGEFMSGRTQVMSDRTYAKLAAAAGTTVAKLKGEPETVEMDAEDLEFFRVFKKLSKDEKRREIRAIRARLGDDDQQ